MNRVIVLFAALILTSSIVIAQDVIWQQEYQASLDGEMTCVYSGGFGYPKPVLVDIDDDGDLDLFVGESEGGVNFIRNDGDQTHPQWTLIDKNYFPFIENFFAPSFCDIDDDGDQDALIGAWDGRLRFFRNDGTSTTPDWTLETDAFDSISVGFHSTPVFCDIDGDTDFDLFVGADLGHVFFYRNEGTPSAHAYALVDSHYVTAQPNVYGPPTFADIDNDQDYDLFVGTSYAIYFFRNDGDAAHDSMTLESTHYDEIHATFKCAVTFEDIDSDGDLDLFVGDADMGIVYYRNVGDADSAVWERDPRFYATIDVMYPGFPAFADLNGDGDSELFMGRYNRGIYMFENVGTSALEAWISPADTMFGKGNIPAFCDIDGDQDTDLFCGSLDGTLIFYENEGSTQSASWADAVQNYDSLKVEGYFSPAFCDIDDDGDFDLFVGTSEGNISFYENVGSGASPQWAAPDSFYLEINVWSRSMPAFCDIDQDGDFDLFVGRVGGTVFFYRNEGDRQSPSFVQETDRYASILLNGQTRPVFVDIDGDGDQDFFIGDDNGGLDFWRNMGLATGITDGEVDVRIPTDFVLDQNYPNPFNPTTDIRFGIAERVSPVHISLKVYNVLGQEIRTLVDEVKAPGYHTVTWDGIDNNGNAVLSGIYFYQLRAEEFTSVRRMVFIK